MIFDEIENSASGYPSEQDIKGLFADFDTTSNRLGNTVKDKNAGLAAVIKRVEGLNFGDFQDNQIDLFGAAYEFLISNYAANAGKSGGEFLRRNVSQNLLQSLRHMDKLLLIRFMIRRQDRIRDLQRPAWGKTGSQRYF